MAFLLNVDHQDDGTTHLTYDIGPTERLNFVTLTENAHHVLDVDASKLLAKAIQTRATTRSVDWLQI